MEKIEVPAAAGLSLIKCRLCKGDHWSAKCPHKDLLQDKVIESNSRGNLIKAK